MPHSKKNSGKPSAAVLESSDRGFLLREIITFPHNQHEGLDPARAAESYEGRCPGPHQFWSAARKYRRISAQG